MPELDQNALNTLFLTARTHTHWLAQAVTDETLTRLFELARMGPTSTNICPLRLVFVKSAAAKEKLKPALAPGNVEKTMSAPVTAIVAWDAEFHLQLPKLFPARDLKTKFGALPTEERERMAFMNGTLEGAYVLLAARALGLDCGPMAGFDNAKVDELFLAGTSWRSNFLMNLGYGDASKLHPRNPRLDFVEAARIE